jgi:hypothetical protein
MDDHDEKDTAGDYSYDMAHEVVGGGGVAAGAAESRHGSPADEPATTTDDTVGDYSYDQAHDIPPAERH